MQPLVTAMFIIAGIIHLLPLPGVFGAHQLHRLYGVAIDDPNLLIAMQHRAVLLGLLGLFLVVAGFRSELRVWACAAGFVGAGSFVALAWMVGGHNALIARVVIADLVAIACLLIGAAADWLVKRA